MFEKRFLYLGHGGDCSQSHPVVNLSPSIGGDGRMHIPIETKQAVGHELKKKALLDELLTAGDKASGIMTLMYEGPLGWELL